MWPQERQHRSTLWCKILKCLEPFIGVAHECDGQAEPQPTIYYTSYLAPFQSYGRLLVNFFLAIGGVLHFNTLARGDPLQKRIVLSDADC